MKARITDSAIKAAQKKAHEEERPVFLWDTMLGGWGARIAPSGQISWVIQRWLGGTWAGSEERKAGKQGGKAHRVVIGSSKNGMTLDEARKAAVIDLGEVAKGTNLVEVKAKKRKKLAKDLSIPPLGKAWTEFWEQHQKGNRYWIEMNASVEKTIAKAGRDTLLSVISKGDIRDWLKDRKGKTAGRTLHAALRPFFKWCVDEEWLSVSPMAGLKSPKAVASRARALKDNEIRAYWKAAVKLEYPWKHYFLLLLLTGQRRQEVAGLRSDEFELDKAQWIIPGERTKNGKEHIVHLSPIVIQIIQEALSIQAMLAKELKVKSSRNFVWVLTTTCKTHIKSYSQAKAMMDKLFTPEKPWRVHDLRHTMVTVMASIGVNPDIADRLLNHVTSKTQSGVQGIYQKFEFLPQRIEALSKWTEHLDQLMRNAAPAPIIKANDSEPQEPVEKVQEALRVAEAPESLTRASARAKLRKSPRKARKEAPEKDIPAWGQAEGLLK